MYESNGARNFTLQTKESLLWLPVNVNKEAGSRHSQAKALLEAETNSCRNYYENVTSILHSFVTESMPLRESYTAKLITLFRKIN